jgi:hypothetical protein
MIAVSQCEQGHGGHDLHMWFLPLYSHRPHIFRKVILHDNFQNVLALVCIRIRICLATVSVDLVHRMIRSTFSDVTLFHNMSICHIANCGAHASCYHCKLVVVARCIEQHELLGQDVRSGKWMPLTPAFLDHCQREGLAHGQHGG